MCGYNTPPTIWDDVPACSQYYYYYNSKSIELFVCVHAWVDRGATVQPCIARAAVHYPSGGLQ